MRYSIYCCSLLLLSGMSAYSQSGASGTSMQCEHLANPIGIEDWAALNPMSNIPILKMYCCNPIL